MPNTRQPIILIGAGLAGSLLAVYLAKRGFKVNVYERRPDMRKTKISAGRSINLALSARGIFALKEVGLYDEIMKIAIPMKGRMIHPVEGATVFQRYGKDDSEVINAVSRGELNMRLMDLAEAHKGVNLFFNQRCTGMDLTTGDALLVDEQTGVTSRVSGQTMIGTDGSASAIRLDMQRHGRFNYSQSFLEHAYKELTIPPGDRGAFRLEKHALHIWPRKTYMLIALPNLDGSFTCTLFYPLSGPHSFETLDTPGKVLAFFREHFPDAIPHMPTLTDDFFANPTGNLVTVKCTPWHVGGKAALLGDAAHAIVPFFGQGMNCAFEDCTDLNRCIEKHDGNWEDVFAEYESLRKTNADAIADLAVENFYEMRDLVTDPRFQLKKKIEHILEEKYPDYFLPKYSMVTFHRMPYAVARRRGQIQEEILDILTTGIHSPEEADLAVARTLLEKRLPPLADLKEL